MSSNASLLLTRVAEERPTQKALLYTEGGVDSWLTYAELEALCNQYAQGLRTFGIRPGDKVLLMESQGVRFIALTLALFRLAAIPVLIDPGMGLENLLKCVTKNKPDILIGVSKAQLLRSLYSKVFATVRRSICTDGRWLGASPLWRVCPPHGPVLTPVNCPPEQPAAIIFTSGSTGPPKAVVYRHGIFHAQVDALREMFDFVPGEIDMPGFPLFAILSLSLAQTCYLPPINPSKPSSVKPQQLIGPINDFGISQLTGSPAIWDKVGQYCHARGIKLPSVKRVFTFGAAISLDLVKTWHQILEPTGDIYTPYGATEALPVASIGGRQLLNDCAAHALGGGGSCVGKPNSSVEVRIVKTTDEVISDWKEDLVLGVGQVGEVVVSGPVVTWSYEGEQEATRASKIIQGDRIWHRMGDLGYLDQQGQLWIVGRKSHRVQGRSQLYYPVSVENMLDGHPDVARTALVGVGPGQDQIPVIVIEPKHLSVLAKTAEKQRIIRELKERIVDHPEYGDIKQFLFHPRFPVDRRHNAKIHREELAEWAKSQVQIATPVKDERAVLGSSNAEVEESDSPITDQGSENGE